MEALSITSAQLYRPISRNAQETHNAPFGGLHPARSASGKTVSWTHTVPQQSSSNRAKLQFDPGAYLPLTITQQATAARSQGDLPVRDRTRPAIPRLITVIEPSRTTSATAHRTEQGTVSKNKDIDTRAGARPQCGPITCRISRQIHFSH
jgi:hypothetical protein